MKKIIILTLTIVFVFAGLVTAMDFNYDEIGGFLNNNNDDDYPVDDIAPKRPWFSFD